MIGIQGQLRERDWLLGTAEGQAALASAKAAGARPRCMCREQGAEMYIATRGNLHYMARMPGTADLHSEDCLAHLVPSDLYSADTPLKLLTTLLSGVPNAGELKWNDLRQKVIDASKGIRVDGDSLQERLLVPTFFFREHAAAQRAKYDQFFADGAKEDATRRRWVFGCIKEASPSRYGARIAVKHMPGIVFWSVQGISHKLVEAAKSETSALCLLEVKERPSGVLITDCAIRNLSNPAEASPAAGPASPPAEPPQTDEAKLAVVREFLRIPAAAPLGDVISAAIDYCVSQAGAK